MKYRGFRKIPKDNTNSNDKFWQIKTKTTIPFTTTTMPTAADINSNEGKSQRSILLYKYFLFLNKNLIYKPLIINSILILKKKKKKNEYGQRMTVSWIF
jgi:hypothetical protein